MSWTPTNIFLDILILAFATSPYEDFILRSLAALSPVALFSSLLISLTFSANALVMRENGPEPVVVQIKQALRTSDTLDTELTRLANVERQFGITVARRWAGRKYFEEISFPASFTEAQALDVIAVLQQLPSVEKVVALSAINLEFKSADLASAYAPADPIPDPARRGFDVNRVPNAVYNALTTLSPHASNRIIVRWKEQFVWKASQTGFLQRLADFHGAAGCRVVQQLQPSSDIDLTQVLEFDAATSSVIDKLLRYQASDWVDYVQPDYIYQLQSTVPNDPIYASKQWSLPKISAPTAWDVSRGSSSVVLAIADSGTNITHPDFSPNLWSGQNNGDIHNFIDGTTNVNDPIGYHGSNVASIVGAQGNNGLCITGVCWDVSLMHLKVTSYNETPTTFSSNLAPAIDYAYNHGATAVNLSVGVYAATNCHIDPDTGRKVCDTPVLDQTLFDHLRLARDHNPGMVAVCAAGNGDDSKQPVNTDSTPFSPADIPTDNVISVAATDQSDVFASFSNYGQKTVDLAAPGVGIYGLKPTFNGNSSDTMNYSLIDGTSQAAPHVTGTIGLIKAKYPWEDYYGLRDRVLMSTDYVGNLNPTKPTRTGGRLNASRALSPRTLIRNLSARARVEGGDRIMIGGFNIRGSGTLKVAIRGLGPSIAISGVAKLTNPTIQLNNAAGQPIDSNDDWVNLPIDQKTALTDAGLQPPNTLEAALVKTLAAGSYTVYVRSHDDPFGFGLGMFEIYELEGATDEQCRLVNVSTRCIVGTGNELAIAGTILGNQATGSIPKRSILIRGLGPTLASAGLPGALANPFLNLFNSSGGLIQSNDSWANLTAPTDELTEAGLAPSNSVEAALWPILSAGSYSVQLSGVNSGTGLGLVELYEY